MVLNFSYFTNFWRKVLDLCPRLWWNRTPTICGGDDSNWKHPRTRLAHFRRTTGRSCHLFV